MTVKFNLRLAKLILCILAISAFKAVNMDAKLKGFNIIITKSNKEIFMTCTSGCAWETLSFKSKTQKPHWVDEYGVNNEYQTADKANKNDKNLVDFRFSIVNNDEGVVLNGLEGTFWTGLSFTLKEGQSQSINHKGMIK